MVGAVEPPRHLGSYEVFTRLNGCRLYRAAMLHGPIAPAARLGEPRATLQPAAVGLPRRFRLASDSRARGFERA